MSYLLDTNVVAELTKPTGDPRLLRWIDAQAEDDLFMSVITIAEVRYGIERMAHGRRRQALQTWLQEQLISRFELRLLPITVDVADAGGRLVAKADALGRPLKAMYGFIAATASIHGLELATRNVRDFEPVLARVLNPWLTGV